MARLSGPGLQGAHMRKNPPSDLLTAVVALLLLFNLAEFMRASGSLIVMLTMSRLMFTPEIAEKAAAGDVSYEKVRAILWSVAIWQSAVIVVRGLSIGALSFLLIRKRYAFWCYAGTVVAVYFIELWGGNNPLEIGYDSIGLAVLVVTLCFTERRLFRLIRKRRAKESPATGLGKKAPLTMTNGTFRASPGGRRVTARLATEQRQCRWRRRVRHRA